MQPSVAILRTIMTVPREERGLLFRLMKEDMALFYDTMLELTRFRRIAESGSMKAWEHFKREKERQMNGVMS